MLTCTQDVTFQLCQLFVVQFGHQNLAGEELAGLGQGFFKSFHDDGQVVGAGRYVAGSIQFAEFLLQLLRFVESHHAGVVHQAGGYVEFGEFFGSGSVLQDELEDVVFLVWRVVHLGTVVQLFYLYVAKVNQVFSYMTDRQALELQGVERLLAYGRFHGLVVGLGYFLTLLGLTLFDVEGQVVFGQILFGYALYVVVCYSHDLVLVV